MRARIMIVEDEAIPALFLRRLLEGEGFVVCAVLAEGELVLASFAETRPDLILMDIRLSGRMDGIQVAEELRRESSVPIVFVSGYEGGPLHERALATFPVAFLGKPVRREALLEAIGAALGRLGA
ncbi:MAG TPA: response regulator [Rectinemataceae bacterium]|nr:response regulator [Rectinemataceae bacterium]